MLLPRLRMSVTESVSIRGRCVLRKREQAGKLLGEIEFLFTGSTCVGRPGANKLQQEQIELSASGFVEFS
uniref:Uncharacterized protein n=1 Tax=Paenibacillus athensensis TaxID=1967502 RepID=A0A4Y8Q6Z8_9BACL